MITPMDTTAHYSLADLGRVAGVTPRTVRYYIAQGLLPGANDSGKAGWYDDRHLARLQLIRELQRQHLPLAEIRAQLAGLGEDQVADLLQEQKAADEAPAESALDYIRTVLGGGPKPRVTMRAMASASEPDSTSPPPSLLRMSSMPASPAMLAESMPPNTAPTAERSQWDRIALTTDIELHVRRPLSRQDHRRVERLITIARQVLGEEQP